MCLNVFQLQVGQEGRKGYRPRAPLGLLQSVKSQATLATINTCQEHLHLRTEPCVLGCQ